MMMETKTKQSLNLVMLPWLAHGHISPYFELAKRLIISNKNIQIHICSTPINLTSINKRITENQSQQIKLIEFHIPSQPDLPPNFHTTNGLPLHLNSTLQTAMNMASPSFIQIIKTLKPDVIIYDVNQPWAASLGIPAVQFITTSASVICFFLHRFMRVGVDIPDDYPSIKLRGIYWYRKFQEMIKPSTNDSGQSGIIGVNAALGRSCGIMFMKTFGEIEGKYMEYGSQLLGQRIVPTGSLVQEQEDAEDNSDIMEWLNKKDTSSTIFVSFGTEYFLSGEEREEIAKGLELSKLNFIWVLRFSFEEKISIEEALPNGFLNRVGDRGLVVEKWAPQARILGHPNIGGFVSHCGWGSTMEAMSFGVPIVAIPMNLDQPINARLVEEIGVGMEVNRGENGGLSGEEIAELIREVTVGEKGKKIRDKVKEMKERIKRKGEEDIDGVVEELYKLHKKNIDGENKDSF